MQVCYFKSWVTYQALGVIFLKSSQCSAWGVGRELLTIPLWDDVSSSWDADEVDAKGRNSDVNPSLCTSVIAFGRWIICFLWSESLIRSDTKRCLFFYPVKERKHMSIYTYNGIMVCMLCVCLSHCFGWLSVTLCTGTHKAPLSMDFSR